MENKYQEDEIIMIDEKAESIIFKENGAVPYNTTVKPFLTSYKPGDKVTVSIYGNPKQVYFIKKSGQYIQKKPAAPKKPTTADEKKAQGWVLLQGKWYPTLEVLLNLAKELYPGRLRIETKAQKVDTENKFAMFQAIVRNVDDEGKVIEEYYATGDAGPDTLAAHMKPAYIRMAETRAIVRALRWITNIGQASVEELPEEERGSKAKPETDKKPFSNTLK